MKFRVERDPLGEVQVPADAYYGAQTQRAVENFPISGLTAPRRARRRHGPDQEGRRRGQRARSAGSPPAIAAAIVRAADDVLAGQLRDQFVVDVYQAGAGTSHNMNTNEVLANRAAEILGGARGDYTRVHPNDHVNMGQSTNDVFPTATRLAILCDGAGLCSRRASGLAGGLDEKSARVRARAEDRAHPSAGRRADHARPGVRRVRRERPSRGGRRRRHRRRSCTS